MDRATGAVEAVLVTGGDEIPYRRAGHGRPVVLLTPDPRLFDLLAARLRVVQPLRMPGDPGGGAWHRWLQGLVDGLGLDRPALVVDTLLAGPVRRLAAIDPDRFSVVVEATPTTDVLTLLLDRHESIDG